MENKVKELRCVVSFHNYTQLKKKKIQEIIGPVPEEYLNLAMDATLKYPALDMELICAVIHHESAKTWDPKIISPMGAVGLMQVMPKTGRLISKRRNISTYSKKMLYNPKFNVDFGCWLLNELIPVFGVKAGLAAYNGPYDIAWEYKKQLKRNPKHAHKYLLLETRKYIPIVLEIYKKLKTI